MNDTLKKLGFTVLVAENQNRKGLSETLLAFDRMIEKGDTAFFFFAGHGFEIGGENYLLPTDVPSATVGQEELIRDGAIAAERIIPACRTAAPEPRSSCSTPAATTRSSARGTRALSGGGGLAAMTPPEGVFVIYSAGAKQTALDRLSNDDTNPNSVFTRNFCQDAGGAGSQPGADRQAHAVGGARPRARHPPRADAGLLRPDRRRRRPQRARPIRTARSTWCRCRPSRSRRCRR